MTRSAILFSVLSCTPIFLIALATIWGGIWVVIAVLFVTLFSAVMDTFVSLALPDEPDHEFPSYPSLQYVLGVGHFAVLGLAVWACSDFSTLKSLEKLGIFIATGLFCGQVSNSNAHELIHASARLKRTIGRWIYISLLFGHHCSAHPLVHHVHVATANDPNSARRGESYYRFLLRAWRGSFTAGYRAETARLHRIGAPRWRNPFVIYVLGAFAFCALAFGFAGIKGALAYVALCGFAQSQLLLSDYVQHYGLRREILASGKPEPVNAKHSWNAPNWFTSSMMLNAPRHSDHHAHPARPFPDLRISQDMPRLPYSLPIMATIALYPRLWRKVMDPRVKKVQT